MTALLKFDEVLAADAAHPFSQRIVRELERAARAPDASRDERKRGIPEESPCDFLIDDRAHYVAHFYYVASDVSNMNYWREKRRYVTLRSVLDSSWKAANLVKPIWLRLEGKGKREQLAALTGIPATNLSSLNTGNMSMTLDLATRIADAVDGVTLLDLGLPEDRVDEAHPGVLGRLAELEAVLKALAPRVDGIDQRLDDLSRRLPPSRRQARSGGES